MVGSERPARPLSTRRPAIVYVLVFAAVGAWIPYWTVFLQTLGVGLGAIGALAGLSAAVGIVAAPAWGIAADRLGDVRGPLLVSSIVAAAAAASLAASSTPAVIAVEIAVLAAGTAGIVPLVDTRTIELLGVDRDRFGRVRAIGSAAFIVASILVGAVVERVGPAGLFLIYCPALALTGVVGAVLLGRGEHRHRAIAVDGLNRTSLLRDPRLGPFFVGSVLVWTSSAAVIAFFSLRLVEIGADAGLIGVGWAINAIVEVPLMLAFPVLVRHVGAERLLVIGAAAFALRAVGFAITSSLAGFLAITAIGGVGFALFYVGSVTYVAAVAAARVRATAQGLFSGTAFAAGTIIGSTFGGALANWLGISTMFAASAAVSILAAAVVWWAVISRGTHGAPSAEPS